MNATSGSSCEIQQNASSLFCRVLCFDFCASCIPINGQRRHPPPPPPLSPPLPPSLALIGPPPPPLSSLLAVSSPLAPPPAPPPYTASRVFGRARCPKFPVSLVAHATGGWSEVNWLEKQGWSSISNSTTSSIIGSSSSGGQRYKVVSPLDARQVWFVVRRGNDELSTDFQKEVATLWSIRHTNLQRLLGYCWEKPGSADSTKSTGAEKAIAYSAPAASVHALEQAEEQVLVFEWVPGGNLHSRLVAAISCASPLTPAFTLLLAPHLAHHPIPVPSPQAVLAGCTAVKMGDPLPSIPAPAPPASLSASAAASVTPAVRLPASHAYMDPILHASARTTPTTDVFSLHSLVCLRAAHLPSAPDAIVLPMVHLALSCTASDPLSRPTVTDLLRSIKALKRSLSAHPRPALPANAGTGGDGDTAGAAGGGGAGEQQGGEGGPDEGEVGIGQLGGGWCPVDAEMSVWEVGVCRRLNL
ncbi:unnamed protein product [Closterium sp. NIES-64]|nr:unnamed protein product [Closterium sp. NIES-64]